MPKIGYRHIFGNIDLSALGHHVGHAATIVASNGYGRAALVASAVSASSVAVARLHTARA